MTVPAEHRTPVKHTQDAEIIPRLLADQEEDATAKTLPGPDDEGLAHTPEERALGENPRQLKRYSMAFSLTTFGIGPVFGCGTTYMIFQLQQIGFLIGYNPGMEPGTGCVDLTAACRVPFGSQDLNLTTVVLYLTAISYAVSGALALFVCGWGDHFRFQREAYVFGLVLYGAICLPVAGLTKYDLAHYNAFAILFPVFCIVGFLATAFLNVFIPYIMQRAAPIASLSDAARADMMAALTSPSAAAAATAAQSQNDEAQRLRAKRQREGISASVWGAVALSAGTVVAFVLTIAITYAGDEAALFGGLYMTTAAGAVCVVCALAGWRFLPTPPGRPVSEGEPFWSVPFTSFMRLLRGIREYPEAFKFLIGFTIWNDSILSFGTVIGTLFNLTVRPDLNEFTGFSILGAGTQMLAAIAFLYAWPHTTLSFRHWTLACYVLAAFTQLWCLFGLAESSLIGYKSRAEFYVFQVLQNVPYGIMSPLFRVWFAELFPQGNEVQYFSLQLVLACLTAWIPTLINGPIADSTNNQRLPVVVSFVCLLAGIGMTWWIDDAKGTAKVRAKEVERLGGL